MHRLAALIAAESPLPPPIPPHPTCVTACRTLRCAACKGAPLVPSAPTPRVDTRPLSSICLVPPQPGPFATSHDGADAVRRVLRRRRRVRRRNDRAKHRLCGNASLRRVSELSGAHGGLRDAFRPTGTRACTG